MGNALLAINGLTKRYRDFTLNNVSFCVPYGTVVGFVGENGAGKSTTLKAILGLIKKDTGTISISGVQEQDIDFVIRNKIGVVFDGNNLPERMTPKQLSDFLIIILPILKEGFYKIWEKYTLTIEERTSKEII